MGRGRPKPRTSGQPIMAVPCEDESLATLTHDLRNSLASIVSALHILRLQRYPNPVAEQAGKTIERQAEHLALLADHLSEVAGVPRPRRRATDRDWQPASDRVAETAQRRLLVVDDNRDAADSTGTLLLLWGHEVKVAYNGPQAVAIAQAFRPDVCLLDLGMPGMSGHELAQQLRREPALKDTVLVAMTGFDRESDRELSRSAGFDAHLVKPVAIAALQEVLRRPAGPASAAPALVDSHPS